MTSEGPSARARVASKREEAEVRSVEKRIPGKRNDDEYVCNRTNLFIRKLQRVYVAIPFEVPCPCPMTN